jgi:two-component system phosphate regulon response regulator PhoB
MTERILIVEDEPDLVATLTFKLRAEGFEPLAAATGREALEKARRDPMPDLVLLDVMLPDLSGTQICRDLKMDDRTRRIPVVMLTARGEEIDRVVGFEVGADDYVTKPFSLRELVLRLRAVLRRGVGVEAPSALSYGQLRVDPHGHRAWLGDEELSLTALELKLLVTLLERKGRFQTRERLLDDVWGIDAAVTTRTVDTHVKRLRHKLGQAAADLETRRGIGYRFREEPE